MPARAARTRVDLRRTAMFAAAEHQGFVEQAALAQVVDQRRIGEVETGEEIFLESWIMVAVRVPGAASELAVAVPENGDEFRARLDQPPRCQASSRSVPAARAVPWR